MKKRQTNIHSAKESVKTKKIREKLDEHFSLIEKKVTPQALKKTLIEINRWINRHASERIILKSKISPFDENRNTAQLSQKTHEFAKRLKLQNAAKPREPAPPSISQT
jgi:hypothetical protein